MKQAKAFTLVEAMVVVAILSVLAALISPVLAKARLQAHITSTVARMRQMHQALKLYQSDYGGDGTYGTLAQMGIPDAYRVFENRLGFTYAFWKSPCGDHPSKEPILMNYCYFPGDGGTHWTDNIVVYRENMYFVGDMNCNDAGVYVESTYQTKLGLGVLYGGRVVRVRKQGNHHRPEWWSDPE